MPPTTNNRQLTMLALRLESMAPLSDEERQAIENLPAKIRLLEAGENIVVEGDKPSQSCLLIDGWAYRYRHMENGKRQILSFHIPGDIPDLMSLHLRIMDHSLALLTEATVAFISHESLLDLIRRFPGIAAVLWRETLVDAANFREWMVGLGRREAYGRIAHLFCELYSKQEAIGLVRDHRCLLPMTQVDLGDALGLSNVHVNRVLQDMRATGQISLRAGVLEIHAWEELVQEAEFDPTYLHLIRYTDG